MVKGKVRIEHSKCIKCYCCQEHCPYNLKLKAPIFSKHLGFFRPGNQASEIENDWR